jgi:uncharacterized protein
VGPSPTRTMVSMLPTREQIQELSDRIVREFRPQRVILFGSVASGTARPDSDVDLLVVMPSTQNLADLAIEVTRRIRPTFWTHIIVRPPEAVDDLIMREANSHGVVLYEAAA